MKTQSLPMRKDCFQTLALTIVVLAVFAAVPAIAEEEEAQAVNERYRARAVSMGTSNPPVLPAGRTATVDIGISRWTTESERQDLLTKLTKGGQEALASALRSQAEAGWIRVTGPSSSTGRSTTRFPQQVIRYSREIVTAEGKRRLILALDRPVSMYETQNRPRWRNHDVSIIIIDFDEDGIGTGQFAIGVQLALIPETGTLTIQSFGTEPLRLRSVTSLN